MKLIDINYLGVWATGGTKKLAKENAEDTIRQIVEQSQHAPEIIVWRYFIGIVYPHLNYWAYRILKLPEQGEWRECQSSDMRDLTREQAKQAVCYNIAQMAWVPEDGCTDVPAFVKNPDDFRDWAKWQLRYNHWIQQGDSGPEAFLKACLSATPWTPQEYR